MNSSISGIELGFVDFLALCGAEKSVPREDDKSQTYFDWFDDMRVYRKGVYLTEPRGATLDELAALPEPPGGDYNTPALTFPTTLSELKAFLDRYEYFGIPDAFALADWIAKKQEERPAAPVVAATEWPYQHDTKLLAAARWVIETWQGDPQWPTSKLVIEKLRDFKELGANEAKHVDSVTRPDHIRNR